MLNERYEDPFEADEAVRLSRLRAEEESNEQYQKIQNPND